MADPFPEDREGRGSPEYAFYPGYLVTFTLLILLPVEEQVEVVEVELAHGETGAGLEGFELGGSRARGKCFHALSAGDQDPALEMPRITYNKGTVKALLIEDSAGFLKVLNGGPGVALHEECFFRDAPLEAIITGHFSLRVGGASPLASGQHEGGDAFIDIKTDGVIEALPEYRGGLVMPGSSSENYGAVSLPAAIAKPVPVDRNGLPDQVESKCSHAVEEKASVAGSLPPGNILLPWLVRERGVGVAFRSGFRSRGPTCCLELTHACRLYLTPVQADG